MYQGDFGVIPAHAGFTFIELLVTLGILAILASIALPLGQLSMQRKQEHELRVALIQIRDALDAYKLAHSQGRIFQGLGGSGYPPSLDVLVDGVVDQRSPTRERIYFMRRLPPDPFYAEPFRSAAETWGKRSYASPPEAPEEGEDVFDVHSRSDRVGLNGIPYRDW